MDLYQKSEILLSSYFGLDHKSSFEIIHTYIDDDHRYYKA